MAAAANRPWLLILGDAQREGYAPLRVLKDIARLHRDSISLIAPPGVAIAADLPAYDAAPSAGAKFELLKTIFKAYRKNRIASICVDEAVELGWLVPALKHLLGANLVVISDRPEPPKTAPAADARLVFEQAPDGTVDSADWSGRARAVARVMRYLEHDGPKEPDLRMLMHDGAELISTRELEKPLLHVIVDTEEEFDWGAPVSRRHTDVFATQEIWRFQEMCDKAGVHPTYVLDYPVAAQNMSARIFRDLAEQGLADIGAHLHAWVTPPFDMVAASLDSYQGNLDGALERAKLETIKKTIMEQVGVAPIVHKAGRYGIGPHTADNLRALGFEIDLSPSSGFDFRNDGGPDFTAYSSQPFWFRADRSLLCLPTTGGVIGKSALLHRFLQRRGHLGDQEHFLRHSPLSALANCVRLSPEGNSLDTMRRLAQAQLDQGVKALTLSLHSTSLAAHANPYAKNEDDVRTMRDTCAQFFRFFREECGGEISTTTGIRQALLDLEAAKARQ